MNKITVRQGSQLDLQVRQGDDAATSVTLIMRNQEVLTDIKQVNAPYVNGLAEIALTSTETSTIGTYDYQINENIPGEDPVIYPDNCVGGDCSLPTIVVCEAIQVS